MTCNSPQGLLHGSVGLCIVPYKNWYNSVMTLKRKLYITSIILLAIAIVSQVFVESPLFESFYPENDWDRLGLALWITMIITLPSVVVAIGSFIAAAIMSIRQKTKIKH